MKKTVRRVINILSNIMMVLAVTVMIFTCLSAVTLRGGEKDVFGYKGFIVLSDSMSATDFSAGDLVITKDVNPDTLQEGDIIAYRSEMEESYGDVITHKIRSITTDEDGGRAFITYGTTTDTDDVLPVGWDQILGKYSFSIPKIGYFLIFLKTIPGYICCIFVPFMILILLQTIKVIRMFKKYKREQMQMIEKEKKQIQKEREETQRMMQEILEMKRQMEEKNTDTQ